MLAETPIHKNPIRIPSRLVGLLSISFLAFFLLLSTSSKADNVIFTDIPITLIDAKTDEPVIGANIYTEDFRFSTTTDVDGKAIISGLGYRDVVIFSYTGYKTQKLPIYEIRRKKGKILMEEEIYEFEGIEIIGRRDDPIREIPYQIERIADKQIRFSNAQTSADLLEKNGGLFVQKSQMGGGSPIIRGFEANRVLLVVDGVRMNNAIYRNGHLQNAITIDPAMLEQAEVIYGPGSLTYGSDALGGVVHYRTKDPQLAFGKEKLILKANTYLRYAYANNEKAFHVDFNQGSRKWGSFTSFSIVDYDNLIAGSKRPKDFPEFGLQKFYATNLLQNSSRDVSQNLRNPNKQWGTEYGQIDILQKIKFQPSDKLYLVANFQYSSSTNIPRYDNLVDTVSAANDLKWREWYYGPQQRILAALKTRLLNQKYFDRGTIIASFQKVDEDRYQRKWKKNWRSANQVDVKVYSLTADFDKFLDKKEQTTISYGLDISRNDVLSDAYEINVRNGDRVIVGNDIITRYPSQGSSMDAYGVYANLKWKSKNQVLTAESGIRYSYVKLAGYFSPNDAISWPQNYINGIFLKNDAITYGGGLTVNTKSQWQFRTLVATAFRSPNIDDFAQIREKNGFITVPNPNLKPEDAFTLEGTIGKQFGFIKTNPATRDKSGISLRLSATAFHTHLTNALVRKNFALPDGSNTLVKDNERLEIQANINAETANVYGFSGNLVFKVADKLEFQSSINLTKGKSRFQDDLEGVVVDTLIPFAHIPPLYGRTSLTFTTGKWKLSAVSHYNGRKRPEEYAVASARIDNSGNIILRRDGTSDNIDYTPYGFINTNGDPCIPTSPRGDTDCNQGYAGALAWMTYNLYGEYQINEKFSVNFGLENITDIHYRPFSSGVSAPGRNFIISFKGSF